MEGEPQVERLVSKARVWRESESLFSELKTVVQGFMDQVTPPAGPGWPAETPRALAPAPLDRCRRSPPDEGASEPELP